MKTKTFYPLADRLSLKEREQFGVSLDYIYAANVKAKFTGEKRCPKAGEWFLSGAVVEAYKAKHDLTTIYHIARLARVQTVEIEVEVL